MRKRHSKRKKQFITTETRADTGIKITILDSANFSYKKLFFNTVITSDQAFVHH